MAVLPPNSAHKSVGSRVFEEILSDHTQVLTSKRDISLAAFPSHLRVRLQCHFLPLVSTMGCALARKKMVSFFITRSIYSSPFLPVLGASSMPADAHQVQDPMAGQLLCTSEALFTSHLFIDAGPRP